MKSSRCHFCRHDIETYLGCSDDAHVQTPADTKHGFAGGHTKVQCSMASCWTAGVDGTNTVLANTSFTHTNAISHK